MLAAASKPSFWNKGFRRQNSCSFGVQLAHHCARGFVGNSSDQAFSSEAACSSCSWNNAAMESFFSSLKTERTARKLYRTRDEAKADVFDYIERFYNPKRRHSTIGYLSPMEFERQAGLA